MNKCTTGEDRYVRGEEARARDYLVPSSSEHVFSRATSGYQRNRATKIVGAEFGKILIDSRRQHRLIQYTGRDKVGGTSTDRRYANSWTRARAHSFRAGEGRGPEAVVGRKVSR